MQGKLWVLMWEINRAYNSRHSSWIFTNWSETRVYTHLFLGRILGIVIHRKRRWIMRFDSSDAEWALLEPLMPDARKSAAMIADIIIIDLSGRNTLR